MIFDAIDQSVSPGPVTPYPSPRSAPCCASERPIFRSPLLLLSASSDFIEARSVVSLLNDAVFLVAALCVWLPVKEETPSFRMTSVGLMGARPASVNTGGSSKTIYSRRIRPLGQRTSTIKLRKGSMMGRLLVTFKTSFP